MDHAPTLRIDRLSGLLLLVLAALWGSTFLFAEIALTELSPMQVTLHRVVIAALALWLVLRLRGVRVPLSPRLWGAYLVMGALNNALPFTLIFWGQTHIESGLAAILNASTGVLGAVVAGLLLRDERLSWSKLVGAALGLAGVAVVIGPDRLTTLDPRNLGQGAVLLAALSYSLASVWAKLRLSGQPPLLNAFGMLAGSAAIMLPLVIWQEGLPGLHHSARVWAALLGLSLLATALAFILYFAILARAGAANLMLVTLLIPPFAIVFGRIFLGEQLPAGVYLGLGIIAAGLVVTDGRLLARLRRRPPAKSKTPQVP
ncbi:DMT family transporter [Alloyangia pacifica]|uniref:Permease of the drug/metabolite transporter (DMT) superfamily n=1 Tax=Alloyangia pacifica TaxID=311180 RepID=A0A1I6SG11_9RHOB|nr:DMT family transporter [Alloyangia pacifica]SDG78722.1 Permease of the drug/metabolite transporter (DMT) superfamily [Alloyangia pacifica]SFS75916.1 Permease of the drug/metabolite transporter (DMT) superfamily [Alloyangia pacifica]